MPTNQLIQCVYAHGEKASGLTFWLWWWTKTHRKTLKIVSASTRHKYFRANKCAHIKQMCYDTNKQLSYVNMHIKPYCQLYVNPATLFLGPYTTAAAAGHRFFSSLFHLMSIRSLLVSLYEEKARWQKRVAASRRKKNRFIRTIIYDWITHGMAVLQNEKWRKRLCDRWSILEYVICVRMLKIRCKE